MHFPNLDMKLVHRKHVKHNGGSRQNKNYFENWPSTDKCSIYMYVSENSFPPKFVQHAFVHY